MLANAKPDTVREARTAQALERVVDRQTVYDETQAGGQWAFSVLRPATSRADNDRVAVEPTVRDLAAAGRRDEAVAPTRQLFPRYRRRRC